MSGPLAGEQCPPKSTAKRALMAEIKSKMGLTTRLHPDDFQGNWDVADRRRYPCLKRPKARQSSRIRVMTAIFIPQAGADAIISANGSLLG